MSDDYRLKTELAKHTFLLESFTVLSKDEKQGRVDLSIPSYDPKMRLDFKRAEFSDEDWNTLVESKRFVGLVNTGVKGDSTLLVVKNIRPFDRIGLPKFSDQQICASSVDSKELIDEIIRLRTAIRDHQSNTTGHGMCWENDVTLWRTLDPSANYPHLTMPSPKEMLAQCRVYIDSRLKGLPYVEPEPKTHAVTIEGKVIEDSSNVRRSE